MKIDIKTPSYYEQYYKVDEEIIKMCFDVMQKFDHKSYSDVVDVIDIIPVVAPAEKLEQGLWEEDIMFSKSIGRISVFKHIEYDKYMDGTVEERKKLTIKCVIEAAWMIKKKPGTKFNAKQFESDFLEFTEYSKEELEII